MVRSQRAIKKTYRKPQKKGLVWFVKGWAMRKFFSVNPEVMIPVMLAVMVTIGILNYLR